MSASSLWLQIKWLPELLLLLVVLAVYGNTIGHSFTQDDAIVIYQNDYTRQGVAGLVDIFSKDSFAGFFKEEGKSHLVAGGRYRPMTLAIFAVIYEITEDQPWAFHLFVVLSYAVLAITIYRLLVLMQIGKAYSKKILAFIATLLFVAHPVHTEVVANVKGLDEIWSLQWSLLAAICMIQFYKNGKVPFMLGAVFLFMVGLLSKENAIVWVGLIPVILWYFIKKRHTRRLAIIAISLLFTAIIYLYLRGQVIGWSLGNEPAEMMNNPFIKQIDGVFLPFTFAERTATIIFSLGKYIQLLFFPHPLTHDYYPRHIGVMDWGDIEVWMASIMNLMLIGIAILGIKKRSFVTFCIFYFYVTIGLMTNILFPVGTHLSERFLFTPSLSFVLMGAFGWHHLSQGGKKRFWNYILMSVFILFCIKTLMRNQVWRDDFTLFTNDVKISKNSAKVRNAAGGALIRRSTEITDESEKQELLHRALDHLQVATTIHPNYKSAYLLIGNAHTYLGDHDAAILSYDRVLSRSPGDPDAASNLILALRKGGREAGSVEKNYDKSIGYLERALRLSPEDHTVTALLGTAYGSKGDHREAIKYFKKAIELKPNQARNYVNLAYAQMNLGEEEEAQINLQRAVEIDPKALQRLNY